MRQVLPDRGDNLSDEGIKMSLYGWVGKILRVDLTTGLISEVPTANYVPKYIGGRGIGAKIHWDEILPSVGAFDPQNKLTFMTGPLVGTPAPSASRTTVQAVVTDDISGRTLLIQYNRGALGAGVEVRRL